MGERHKNSKPLERGWMKKEYIFAGSPYSLWLKEYLTGEIDAYVYGSENRGLVQKHGLKVNKKNWPKICDDIMCIKKFDNLQGPVRKIAIDIIRMELDSDFKG